MQAQKNIQEDIYDYDTLAAITPEEYIGTVHPRYGGRLIDLMWLPDNYWFHVTNGEWDGVAFIQDGTRYIATLTADKRPNRQLPVTDANRFCLWLDITDEEFVRLREEALS